MGKKIIKFEDIEDSLASIQKKNSTAQTDAEYIKIMEELIQLTVPKSIFESKKASSLRFIPNKEQMNLGILKDIAGGDYDENKKNLYHNSIVGWDIENIDAQISFTEVSADYDDIQESIISVYKLKINAKQGRIDSYIIIKDLENNGWLIITKKPNYTGISLNTQYKTEIVEFIEKYLPDTKGWIN